MTVDANILGTSDPLGLKSIGQNVCFFNSVDQMLYLVNSLREHTCLFNTHKPVVLIIKELFKQI